MTRKKIWMVPLLAGFLLFMIAPIAEAHVTVKPSVSSTNAYEKYTVRVPVEKDINTTGLEVKVPEGINVVSILPMADWDYELEKDDNELISTITWTTSDAGIGPNEFMEFSFIGANPSEPGEFSWEALQTYEDESVVEWIGLEDSDEPASVTSVTEGDAVAPHDDNEAVSPDKVDEESTEKSSTDSNSSNWLPILLSSVAILLALISLFRKPSKG